MGGLKLTRTLLVLTLMAMTVTSQPMSAVSGGTGTLALVINWGQVAVESLLEWAKNIFFSTKVNEPTGHKILIIGGEIAAPSGPSGISCNSTKIIDLQNDDFVCNLPDYPVKMQAGIGGIVEDDIPLICGGYWKRGRSIYECFKLVDKSWEIADVLETDKVFMGTGNVVINKKLLLSGGYDGDSVSDKMSLMDTISSTIKLKDMPKAISDHCIVKLDQSKILLIGGNDDNGKRSETLIFNLENQQWSDGPRMRQKRRSHGCVKGNLNGKPIIWVTGGYAENRLKSTEYLDLENLNQGWQSGTLHIIYKFTSFFFHKNIL